MSRALFTFLAVLIVSNVTAETSKNIEDDIKRLAKDQPKALRLAAIKRLRTWDKKESLRALPALDSILKDKDADVRSEALIALAEIAFDHEQTCPLGVLEGYLDPHENVRGYASTYAGAVWKTYPTGARAILLKAITSADAHVRHSAVSVLAAAMKLDAEVLAALRKATADPKWAVRNNAHVALWHLTGDLAGIVPYWLEILGRHEAEAKAVKDEAEAAHIRLLGAGAAIKLKELGDERPEEIGPILIKLLSHKTSVIRAMAARILGATALTNTGSRATLVGLKVDAELGPLLKDAEPMVRSEASTALQRLKDGNPAIAIQQVLDAQVVAWNKGDLRGFMEGYWQSPDLTFFSGGNKTRGWQPTLERYQKKYQGEGKEMGKLAFKDINIKGLGSDRALVTGRWQLELKKEPVGGLFTLLFQKKDAGWRIVHDHTSN